MNILQIVNEFCRRTAVPVQAAMATSQDDQALQLMALCNEILDDLGERKAWTMLHTEATFTTLAAEDQGALATIASGGYTSIMEGVLFDRTNSQYILGSVSPSQWQAAKANLSSISDTQYREMQGHLYLTPAPAAGDTIAFEYVTSYPVVDNSTAPVLTSKAYFTSDADTCLYPDKLLILGLRWLWKREKGIRYGEEFRHYESAVVNFMGKDGGKQAIDISCDAQPANGIIIPDRSWPL
jgi:hypothetical protein